MSPPSPMLPDLGFLSQYPAQARAEVEMLFAKKHLMVCGSWLSAWQSVASFCIELEDCALRNGVPELFDRCLPAIGPGVGELKVMMRAKRLLEDPRYVSLVSGKISPAQICGAVDAYRNEQLKLNGELAAATKYDVETSVADLSFESVGTGDVLQVSPTLAGATGEESIKSILQKLGIPFEEQWQRAYPCDFGEMKRPDFKVGTVRSTGDARLSSGFYIESTQRLSPKNRDLGLFYLLHQIVQYADLPTVVVYDGPMVSDRVWDWAQAFKKKHERDGRLFAVATHQQFREWALRKLGRQG